MRTRVLVFAILLMPLLARAADPTALRLPSGSIVPILSIRKTTLHESNEVALVLTYQTTKDFTDMNSVGAEIEQVWTVFVEVADREKVGAAVVVASEPPSSFALTKSAGRVWKKGVDGQWRRPAKNDPAVVPRGQHP